MTWVCITPTIPTSCSLIQNTGSRVALPEIADSILFTNLQWVRMKGSSLSLTQSLHWCSASWRASWLRKLHHGLQQLECGPLQAGLSEREREMIRMLKTWSMMVVCLSPAMVNWFTCEPCWVSRVKGCENTWELGFAVLVFDWEPLWASFRTTCYAKVQK